MPASVAVIHLQGDVLLPDVSGLGDAVGLALRGERPAVVVDVSGVRYCSCAAMGLLAGAAGWLRGRRGALRLVGAGENLLRAFRAAGLDRAVEFCDTIEDARLSLGCQVLSPEREALLGAREC